MGYDIRTPNYRNSRVTEINLTPPLTFKILKEDIVSLPIPVTTDLSAKSLRFEVKEDKDDLVWLILKKNTLGGGDDSQILVSPTEVSVGIQNTDTQFLVFDGYYNKYFWQLKNITDEQTVAWGFLIVIKTTISLNDGTPPPNPSAVPELIFTLIDENTYSHDLTDAITIERNTFGANLRADLNDTGKYTIHSDIAIFIPANDIEISFLAAVSADVYKTLQSSSSDGKDLYIE